LPNFPKTFHFLSKGCHLISIKPPTFFFKFPTFLPFFNRKFLGFSKVGASFCVAFGFNPWEKNLLNSQGFFPFVFLSFPFSLQFGKFPSQAFKILFFRRFHIPFSQGQDLHASFRSKTFFPKISQSFQFSLLWKKDF